MNKKDLTDKIAAVLRDNDIRKPISIPKHVFHISDDDGNTANFGVKRVDKRVFYTRDDVSTILDAYIAVVTDAVSRGEEVNVRGFGTISLYKRAARRSRVPGTGEWLETEGRYVPKFRFSNDLRFAARKYELSLDDKYDDIEYFDDDEDVDEEGAVG